MKQIACAAALAGALASSSQMHGADADHRVEVDVVVTDVRARAVTNLEAADFELIDSGQVRSLDSVRAPGGGTRVLGLFLDEFHVDAGVATDNVKTALRRLIDAGLRDGDAVAIVKPLDPLHSITLMHDRDAMRRAIDTFAGRRGDYSPRTPFEQEFISRDPKTAGATRRQVVSAALQALTARLGAEGDGRKALVILSDDPPNLQTRSVIAAANRHRVSIYPINPASGPGAPTPGFQQMADETGGRGAEGGIAPALDQVLFDLDHYILLSYIAPEARKNGFHPVRVQVKRPSVTVRSRSGYFTAPPPVPRANRIMPAALPFRPSHTSRLIRAWVGMSRGIGEATAVTLTWEAAAMPARNQRITSVVVKASAADGTVIAEGEVGERNASLRFEAPAGMIALEMKIQSAGGTTLDTDYRTVIVPSFKGGRAALGTPQLLRSRTARTFADLSADPDAAPASSRTFSRAERLIVRVPAYVPDAGRPPTVTAQLLNRTGQRMRTLQMISGPTATDIVQFDLPLSSLAPGEYRIEITCAPAVGPEARDVVLFEVTD